MPENGLTFDLGGKVALVTGAAGGLGAATARILARHGARVVAGDIDEAGAGKVAEEIGGRALHLDVTDPGSVEQAVESILTGEGRLDILINNAGIDYIRPATELTLEEWDRVHHTNLRGPWLLSRAVFPHMAGRGSGQIVNVASTAAKKGWSNATAYSSSKHGLMGLTQALHAEGRERGVRVMALVAGGMRTNFFRTLDPPPPKETLQPPENVAAAILFMVCQPEESVIQELVVTPMTETSYP
ncbi:SDR family oxidoreductase [Rubrobacter taiwanensis]|uniref:SDR family oxidoreductase n=1 Tax=Rubrobacter taiwanensis TaxID=185139 RepID=A0A4V2NWC4_9ACTN|nr:SDR family oxidoreductase [Rubrobacter taiwanensis]TCJ16842.1 SDR family oxidoreductase [Rubrobacter taiwanensis]